MIHKSSSSIIMKWPLLSCSRLRTDIKVDDKPSSRIWEFMTQKLVTKIMQLSGFNPIKLLGAYLGA